MNYCWRTKVSGGTLSPSPRQDLFLFQSCPRLLHQSHRKLVCSKMGDWHWNRLSMQWSLFEAIANPKQGPLLYFGFYKDGLIVVTKIPFLRAVIVAQLIERSLLTPEIRGSNLDIGKILSTNCTIDKTKIKKKRPGMAHLKKDSIISPNLTTVVWRMSPKSVLRQDFSQFFWNFWLMRQNFSKT